MAALQRGLTAWRGDNGGYGSGGTTACGDGGDGSSRDTTVCGGGSDGSGNGDVLVIKARSGGGSGSGGDSGDSGGDGGWTPSPTFSEQPLKREETPFYFSNDG